MKGFRVFIDLKEGRAVIEGGVRAREPHPSGLILAADARLDNRQELLDALAGNVLATSKDSDLILAAYLKWGERCPEHLLGDFAFVIWNARSRRLFGARDQLGIRSLYYTRVGTLLGVASEVHSLLQHPGVPRRVDPVAVGDYLVRITSEPDRTFFQDVHRLSPAHTLTATPESLQVHRYWDVGGLTPLSLSEEDAAHRFLELFRQAVRDRLDAPGGTLGVAMSGGLDSTSVAAVAVKELEQHGAGPLMAFSFAFDGLKECDERPYVSALSKALGIETSFINAEHFWFLGDEEAYTPPLETPTMSWESPFQQMLHAFRQRGGRVLLTGHGADDLLQGSRFVYADRLRRGDFRVFAEIWKHSRSRRHGWRPFYRLLVEPQLDPGIASALRHRFSRIEPSRIPSWIAAGFAQRIRLAERLAAAENGPAERTARSQMYQRLVSRPSYHRSIEWYDRNSEPFGIEVRHPVLDRRLFEFIFALSPEHLFRLGERKQLLRRALAGILPDFVRLRPKIGLGSFVDFSLRKEADRVWNLLTSLLSEELGMINGEVARQVFKQCCAGESSKDQHSLWYVITLELWLRRHFHTFYATPEILISARKTA